MSDAAIADRPGIETPESGDLGQSSPRQKLAANLDSSAVSTMHPLAEARHDQASSDAPAEMTLVMDIPVCVTVELGRTKIPIKQILRLSQGSVLELDAVAGEPMDVYVNGCLIAQGEVVVLEEKFGIRLTDIITPAERVRRFAKA